MYERFLTIPKNIFKKNPFEYQRDFSTLIDFKSTMHIQKNNPQFLF
jgi:hypothetical protein